MQKLKYKININQYSTFEYVNLFNKFFNRKLNIVIKDENTIKIINVSFSKSQLPHLMGIQYAYDKKSSQKNYKGMNAYHLLINNQISFNDIKNNVNKII